MWIPAHLKFSIQLCDSQFRKDTKLIYSLAIIYSMMSSAIMNVTGIRLITSTPCSQDKDIY